MAPSSSLSDCQNSLLAAALAPFSAAISSLIFGVPGTWFGFAFLPITFELLKPLRSVDGSDSVQQQ